MAQFLRIGELAEAMAGTASRLKKRAAIAEAIAAVQAESPEGEDAGRFAMYLAGTPFAESDPRKLNAGGALLTRAVLAVSGASDAELTVAYRRHGDLGAAAFDLLAAARAERQEQTAVRKEAAKDGPLALAPALSLGDVAEAFAAMAAARTTAVRAALVDGLLRRATPLEAKYLLKLMLGDMRIGVKQSLVEEAIAVAAACPVAAVRHAVMLEADLGSAVRRAFSGTLGEARLRIFHPLGFMLASPVESPEEAIERFAAKAESPKRKSKAKQKDEIASAMHSEPDLPSKSGEETVGPSGRESDLLGDEEAIGSPKPDDDLSGDDNAPPLPEGAESRLGRIEAFLEDKYDGMRAQVHCGDPEQPGRVAIYSRNREDITESFPELAEAFARVELDADAAGPLVFDGEILGWDFGDGSPAEERGLDEPESHAGRALPFAVLGQRIGRKRVSNEWRVRVPAIFMAFDLMVQHGEPTLHLPLRERRNRLEAVVERLVDRVVSPLEGHAQPRTSQTGLFALDHPPSPAVPRLMLSPSRLVESADDIDRAYAAARARANEGVMIKAADSVYQPGRRGLAWVKLKRELATLDVVITGAEYGHGRRAGLLSDYTFAVRGPDLARTGEACLPGSDGPLPDLLNVGKAYSGVTDLEIAELTEFLKAHTLEDHGHFRTVEPLVVLEVAFNNIMRSTRHASGFALRFPRILRLRPDKPLAEIDTLARVEAIYQSQVDKPADNGE